MMSNQLRPRRNSRVAGSPPANLTSGGTIVPTTVPHSGRESSKRAPPLCEDGSLAPRRTTATSPWTREHLNKRLEHGRGYGDLLTGHCTGQLGGRIGHRHGLPA